MTDLQLKDTDITKSRSRIVVTTIVAFVAMVVTATTAWSHPIPPTAGKPTLKLIKLTTDQKAIKPPEPVLVGQSATLAAVFTTWCKPCEREIPILNKLYAETFKKGVRIIGISTDEKPPAGIRQWMRQKKIRYPVYYANTEVKSGRSILGDISNIPHTLLLSAQGQVLRRWVGLVPINVLRAAIEPLVKKPKR